MMAKLLSFKDMLTVEYRPGEDELTNYRVQKRKRTAMEHNNCGTPDCCGECDTAQLDEIQIGWHHKTQKYHTIKHPDGSHYGVYDSSSYGTRGYEIRKIRDKNGKSLRAKEGRSDPHMDRYRAGPHGGPTKAAKVWVKKHGGTITNHKVKESVEEVDEALTITQRMARGRMMKRMKSRIKIGRDRARRRMANKATIERRAQKAARKAILRKLTKGADKRDLPFARRQELEKRLEKPALKKRIKILAKRLVKDLRKKEVERRKR